MKKTLALVLVAGLGLVGVHAARASSDDDLAVVRKALQKTPGADAPKTGGKPQWVHVRVEGKKEKKEKVSINIPFALVEALGDQEICHTWKGEHKAIHLSDLLKSLEAGQQLVEVDDEEETVKIWID
jgi:hypothetical protein